MIVSLETAQADVARDWFGPGATFSDCRKYRYTLNRRWVHGVAPVNMVAFIGLNPSTADETLNDPTIRRCIQFAKDWGFGGLVMLNLFAYRATDPKVMKAVVDPVGRKNNEAIVDVAIQVGGVICAWGTHGIHMGRASAVRSLLADFGVSVQHLGLTKDGHPKHPLYLKSTSERIGYVQQ